MALDLGLDCKGPPRHARTPKMDLLKMRTSDRLAPQGNLGPVTTDSPEGVGPTGNKHVDELYVRFFVMPPPPPSTFVNL